MMPSSQPDYSRAVQTHNIETAKVGIFVCVARLVARIRSRRVASFPDPQPAPRPKSGAAVCC
jgi:hypothetical protein